MAKEIYLFKKKDGDEVSKKLWRSKELWKEVWESNKEEKIKKGCDISKKSRKQNTQTNKIIISTMKKKINLFEIGYGDEVNKKLRQSKSLCVWANFALCSNCVWGRARPSIPCEGKRTSEDIQPRNGQNYHPRRGGACL